MKHVALFLGFAACGTQSIPTPPAETRQEEAPQPSAPTVEQAAVAVAPPPIPWQNWPGNGVVRCHYSDPRLVTADLVVTIDGDTHTSTLHVTDVATGLSGDGSATYRPVSAPTSLEIVTGTSVRWVVDGRHMLGWVAGLNVETMTMYMACGGEYAASHGLCMFTDTLPMPQASCTYTAAP